MKKTVKQFVLLVLLTLVPYFKADSMLTVGADVDPGCSTIQEGSGIVLSLNNGSRSGLIQIGTEGEIFEFQCAEPDELEVNVFYTFSYFKTGSGKIIVRDIQRKTAPTLQ